MAGSLTGPAPRPDADHTSAIPLGVSPAPPAVVLPALQRLVGKLDEGADWDAAFDAYYAAITGQAPRTWPPPDGRVNWTWLTDLDRFEHVVDLGSPFGELAASLSSECADVTYVGVDSVHGGIVRRRVAAGMDVRTVWPESEEWRPEPKHDLVAFVVAVGYQERLPQAYRSLSSVVDLAARLLRPGGWLGVLMPNPVWYRQLRLGRRTAVRHLVESYRLRGLRRKLERAGFSECREYVATASNLIPHGTPMASLDVSMMFVPNQREALANYLALAGVRGRRAKLADLGMGDVLLPVRLVLARR